MKLPIAVAVTIIIAVAGSVWQVSTIVNALEKQDAKIEYQQRLNQQQIDLNSRGLKSFQYEQVRNWIYSLETKCNDRRCDPQDVETLIRYKGMKQRLEKELGYVK